MIEAIQLCEELTGRKLNWVYSEQNRAGDHMWYISDVTRFQSQYPEWSCSTDLRLTLTDLRESLSERALMHK